MRLNKVYVKKGVAQMEPCKMCGATAYEGCKQAKGLPLGECPYYQRYNTGG